MSPTRAAVAAWRKQPAKVRAMVLSYFRAEAEQSREWAKEAPLFGTRAENLADAAAFEAAVAALRALGRRSR